MSTTAAVKEMTASSTYPPTPSCSRIAPYIPAASIGWPRTVPTVPTVPTRDRNSTGHTERTDGRLCAAPGGGGIHAFAFLPIRYAFLYRTCLPTSFHKNSLKSPFTYIGTKKAKNSHLKIKFFQKNLRAAETAPKSEKSGYIIVSNCGRSVFPLPGSVQAADKQYTVLHRHRRSEDYKLHER